MAKKRGDRARKLGTGDPEWQAKTRTKIQTSQIVNALNNHVLGKVKMESTQVAAARILMDKTLPSLQSQEIDMNSTVEVADVSDKMPTSEEWQARNDVKETEVKH